MKPQNTIEQGKDWLDSFHEGNETIRMEVIALKHAAKYLQYPLPNVAKDLFEIAEMIEFSREKMGNAISQSLNERMQEHNTFIGEALSACLHVKK